MWNSECIEASRASTIELKNCFRGKFTMKILLTPEVLKNIVNFDHGRSQYLSYRTMGGNFKTRSGEFTNTQAYKGKNMPIFLFFSFIIFP